MKKILFVFLLVCAGMVQTTAAPVVALADGNENE